MAAHPGAGSAARNPRKADRHRAGAGPLRRGRSTGGGRDRIGAPSQRLARRVVARCAYPAHRIDRPRRIPAIDARLGTRRHGRARSREGDRRAGAAAARAGEQPAGHGTARERRRGRVGQSSARLAVGGGGGGFGHSRRAGRIEDRRGDHRPAPGPAAGRIRRGADRARAGQPAGERGQVRAAAGGDLRAGHAPHLAAAGARPRRRPAARHGRSRGPAVREVHPRRGRIRDPRRRSRARDLQGDRRRAWRQHLSPQCGRRRGTIRDRIAAPRATRAGGSGTPGLANVCPATSRHRDRGRAADQALRQDRARSRRLPGPRGRDLARRSFRSRHAPARPAGGRPRSPRRRRTEPDPRRARLVRRTDHRAVGTHRRVGQDRGTGCRRGRLPDQAVRYRRTAGTGASSPSAPERIRPGWRRRGAGSSFPVRRGRDRPGGAGGAACRRRDPPDPDRIPAPHGAGRRRGPGHHPKAAAARGLGAGAYRPEPLPSHLHGASPAEARSRPGPAAAPVDRDRHRLSIGRLKQLFHLKPIARLSSGDARRQVALRRSRPPAAIAPLVSLSLFPHRQRGVALPAPCVSRALGHLGRRLANHHRAGRIRTPCLERGRRGNRDGRGAGHPRGQ
ncbi:putative PE-PGRS family protein [Burkholderiales bacterium 8X]|nr:putative PE-PGRS family protein [Burkholderiales bacterium 8X]